MPAVEQRPTATSPYAPAWVGVRVVLAAAYVVLLLAGIVVHQEGAALGDLYADAERGELSRVVVRGDALEPGATGSAKLEVTWSTGLRRWRVDVTQDVPEAGRVGGLVSGTDAERTTDDVGQQVRLRDSSVEVVRRGPRTAGVRLWGAGLSEPQSIPLVATLLAAVVLLIVGPEPWRATRWAWFWLLSIPGAELVWLVRSGPTPRLSRPPMHGARLTGGRAFAVSVLGSVVVNAAVALLVRAVWPAHG